MLELVKRKVIVSLGLSTTPRPNQQLVVDVRFKFGDNEIWLASRDQPGFIHAYSMPWKFKIPFTLTSGNPYNIKVYHSTDLPSGGLSNVEVWLDDAPIIKSNVTPGFHGFLAISSGSVAIDNYKIDLIYDSARTQCPERARCFFPWLNYTSRGVPSQLQVDIVASDYSGCSGSWGVVLPACNTYVLDEIDPQDSYHFDNGLPLPCASYQVTGTFGTGGFNTFEFDFFIKPDVVYDTDGVDGYGGGNTTVQECAAYYVFNSGGTPSGSFSQDWYAANVTNYSRSPVTIPRPAAGGTTWTLTGNPSSTCLVHELLLTPLP